MIRVYQYGVLPNEEDLPKVLAQMRLAHRYRNTLTEIERARRAAVRDVMRAVAPELEEAVAAADVEVTRALERANKDKAERRAGVVADPLRDAVREARARKRAAIEALREARKARRSAETRAQLGAIEERALYLRKNAREHSGVYWGTYLLVEEAAENARKQPLYDLGRPADPHFCRWDGCAQIGVQVQGGMPIEALTSDDTRLRLVPAPLPKGADPTSKRSLRRPRRTLYIRIGSAPDRSPIFARFAVVLHRPLPEGARIKTCKVSLRTYGTIRKWTVLFTLELPDALPVVRATGRVGLDLGWRVLESGDIRVGKWYGDDGQEGEIRLPSSVRARLDKSDSLRRIRDRNFDEARATLAMHLGTLALPEWLATETRSLAQWRGFGRLATLTHRWRERRFEGDAAAFGALEAWRAQDEHLWDWEANQRRKTLLYRRELYRIAAADLAPRYETVVLEKFHLRAVATLPDATSASSDNDNARSVRFVAAPSELRLAVTQAFVARSGRVEHVDAAGTTYICAACGSAEEWDQARELRHTCSRCAREWDQDDNAARNILARAPAPNEEMAAAPARYEGRWQRVKARKKEAL